MPFFGVPDVAASDLYLLGAPASSVSEPNVMVPRQRVETAQPLRPSVR